MKSLKDLKIKDLILHNFALKILAIIIAIVLWIVIVNIDNPSKRQPITGIGVSILNGSVLTDKGYIYQVESGAIISIVIKAPQSIADELKASDFYAYADISERMTESDRVQIHVSCIKEDVADQVDIVSLRTEYVQLSIDNKVDKELPLDVEIEGTPASGYVVGDYSLSPTTIKLTGAESIVSEISGAKLSYNVDSMTATIDDMVKPVFYNKDGKEVPVDKLELSRNAIRIKIDILPTKWVPINYVLTGSPAEGYALVNKSTNISMINIAGTKEALAAISSIDIPAGEIDISGCTEDKTIEVPLSAYIPAKYKNVSSTTILKVVANIEKISDIVVNVPIDQIDIVGKDTSLMYEVVERDENQVVEVGINGVESEIAKVTTAILAPYIDVTGRGPGEHTLKIVFSGGENYEVTGNYYLTIRITDPNAETESESESEPESEISETVTDENETSESETLEAETTQAGADEL